MTRCFLFLFLYIIFKFSYFLSFNFVLNFEVKGDLVLSTMSDDGLSSLRDLFEDSSSEVSIREVFNDSVSEVGSVSVADNGAGNTGGMVCSTPVKRRVQVIAPRSSRIAARFSGGSLDRRGFRGTQGRFSPNSPAGDLELPPSSTWSNGVRSGFCSGRRFVPASSWDSCPVDPVDVREALALKGRRNNRAMAEHLIGRFTSCEDREAEKRLGKGRGHFASKVWQSYGKERDRKVCHQCMGLCCGALRDFVSRLVEADFLDAASQSPNVSCCCLFSFYYFVLLQDFANAVRRLIWRFECWRAGIFCLLDIVSFCHLRGCLRPGRGGTSEDFGW